MLLMVEKDIREGICQCIYWYVKDYDKIKNCHIFNVGT